MASAAELYRRTVFDHTHVIAVFLAEKRHGSHRFSLGNRGMTAFLERHVLTNQFIGHFLHFAQLFSAHFLEMGEVKTQAFGRNQTTLLLHMSS